MKEDENKKQQQQPAASRATLYARRQLNRRGAHFFVSNAETGLQLSETSEHKRRAHKKIRKNGRVTDLADMVDSILNHDRINGGFGVDRICVGVSSVSSPLFRTTWFQSSNFLCGILIWPRFSRGRFLILHSKIYRAHTISHRRSDGFAWS